MLIKILYEEEIKIEQANVAITLIYIGLTVLFIITFLIGRGKRFPVKLLLWGLALLMPLGLLYLSIYTFPSNLLLIMEHPHGFKLFRRTFFWLGGIGILLLSFSISISIEEIVDNVGKRFSKKDE